MASAASTGGLCGVSTGRNGSDAGAESSAAKGRGERRQHRHGELCPHFADRLHDARIASHQESEQREQAAFLDFEGDVLRRPDDLAAVVRVLGEETLDVQHDASYTNHGDAENTEPK